MSTNFEQVDEFCVIVEDYDKDNIARYEWICSKDLSEYHGCITYQEGILHDNEMSVWKYLSHSKDKDGFFTGVVQNQCEECGEKFESEYSESSCNPEIIDREAFESGTW